MFAAPEVLPPISEVAVVFAFVTLGLEALFLVVAFVVVGVLFVVEVVVNVAKVVVPTLDGTMVATEGIAAGDKVVVMICFLMSVTVGATPVVIILLVEFIRWGVGC